MTAPRLCTNCGNVPKTPRKGLCQRCYFRQYRAAKAATRPPRVYPPLLDRLLDKAVPGWGGCILWTGGLSRYGYGRIINNGSTLSTHRVAYELLVGPIPEGLTIDHLCRVTVCINPHHLEPVTSTENLRRAAQARKHCSDSHELTPENPYSAPGSINARLCRTCRRNRALVPATGGTLKPLGTDYPGDSDPDPDEALRRARQTKPRALVGAR